MVRAGAGTHDRGNLALRYGGTAGASGAYRVFTQASAIGDSTLASGGPAGDHWRSLTSGFRGDWKTGPQSWLLEGSVSTGEQRPLWTNLDAAGGEANDRAVSRATVGHVLGRWTRARANGDELQILSFVDAATRHEAIGDYRRHTLDLDAVYRTARSGRNNLVFGGGYRAVAETMDGGPGYSFDPRSARETLLHVFAQDEVALPGRFELTLGAKYEHESDDGGTLQPTARLLWNGRRQHAWTAVSRAIRTPSMVDKGVYIQFPATALPGMDLPVVLTAAGNPAALDERLVTTEGGYRFDVASWASLDVAAFTGHYSRLQTIEATDPELVFTGGQPAIRIASVFGNLLDADTKGAEIAARVRVNAAWQLAGTFSAFHLTPHLAAESRDQRAERYDGRAPAYQWRVHSALAIGNRIDTDLLVFHVGPQQELVIPAYTRVDARVEWALGNGLSVAAEGQNLLTPSHPEFGSDNATILPTRVPRGGVPEADVAVLT